MTKHDLQVDGDSSEQSEDSTAIGKGAKVHPINLTVAAGAGVALIAVAAWQDLGDLGTAVAGIIVFVLCMLPGYLTLRHGVEPGNDAGVGGWLLLGSTVPGILLGAYTVTVLYSGALEYGQISLAEGRVESGECVEADELRSLSEALFPSVVERANDLQPSVAACRAVSLFYGGDHTAALQALTDSNGTLMRGLPDHAGDLYAQLEPISDVQEMWSRTPEPPRPHRRPICVSAGGSV